MDQYKQRKKRWSAFLDMKSSVNRVFIATYCNDLKVPERPQLGPENKRARIDWAYERFQRESEMAQRVDDDFIPFLSVATGTEIFAEAFGCAVYRPEDNMPFALPRVNNAAEADRLEVPVLFNTSLAELFDMADALRARAGKDALVGLPDIQSPMDICALIWEKCDFMAALHEHPESVKRLSQKVLTLQCAFLDTWFERYGRDFSAHFPDYYMPRGMTLSEDEIGAVSAEMFDEFFRDELNFLSERYGGIGIHCCANARHQWDNLAQIKGLKLINICQDRAVTIDAYNRFAPVCAQYPCEGGIGEDELRDPAAVHMVQRLDRATAMEAADAVKRAREASERAVIRG